MQTVVRETKNIHTVFDDIEKFYTYTSEKKEHLLPFVLDNSFVELVLLFENYADFECDVKFIDKQYPKIKVPKFNKKNVILAFSGGKDSVASALKLKKDGYNIRLYHVKGINAVYDEYRAVEALAKDLDLLIYFDTVKLSGHHQYVEHPMKNIIIANGALQYGIRENFSTQIVFGNYINSSVEDDNFIYCGGDDIETWETYVDIIKPIIPNFQLLLNLDDLNETLEILSKNTNLWELSQSCIGRAGLREYNKKKVEDKYHIHLLKNRCGLCYKCAAEYVYMTDHSLCDYNEAYYNHCIHILTQNHKREIGKTPDLMEVWNYYFKYDISKSHLKIK